jgi:hypothetical protein
MRKARRFTPAGLFAFLVSGMDKMANAAHVLFLFS